MKHTLTAKDVRVALGIDTSRSVVSIPSAVKNDEEFKIDKTQLDKRCSVDLAAKVRSQNELVSWIYCGVRS